MFARNISVPEVTTILQDGEVIEDYADDKPYPSLLLLGMSGNRWLHVVAAREIESGGCVVVTTYEPNPILWESDCRTRRPK